jgi:ATP-dependent DNA helicase RecG
MSRRYRNRRIGEFLKELDLTEGRGTGVPKILRAMRENGSPPPIFEFDEDHSYFATVLPVHPAARAAATDLRGTPTAQVTAQVATLVEHLDGELTRSELQEAVGLTHREHFRKAYLLPALEAGLVEMTQPDKPNSRSQRYRLTAAGREFRRKRGAKP